LWDNQPQPPRYAASRQAFRAGRQRGSLSSGQPRRLKSYPNLDNFRLSLGQKDFAAPQGLPSRSRGMTRCAAMPEVRCRRLTIITGTTADRSAHAIKPVSSPRGMQRRPRRPRNLHPARASRCGETCPPRACFSVPRSLSPRAFKSCGARPCTAAARQSLRRSGVVLPSGLRRALRIQANRQLSAETGRLSLANRIHWMRRPTQHSHPCIEALGRPARRVTNRIRSPR
jgi:hypothetical protein